MAATPNENRKGGGGNATTSGVQFQAGVGALFAARLLAEAKLDDLLGLADAHIRSIRFETNAPVDDILIETDQGGFVAIQAKSSISLGSKLNSVLGSVVDQFVRYWLVTREGDNIEPWARPLDKSRDRLLLVHGPGSGSGISHLAVALTGARPDGPTGKVRDRFEQLVGEAFVANGIVATSADIAALVDVIQVIELDPMGRDRGLATEQLAPIFGSREDATIGLEVIQQICTDQMKRRSGFDSARLRTALAQRGITMGAAPTFSRSIDALATWSMATSEQLASYEKLAPKEGDPFTLDRDCLPKIIKAARDGSLILTGEPGSGKSGLLNALARALGEGGTPVVTLAVDRLPVATLNELSDQLGLEHPILDVLANWPGTGPAYLVIDALDATRGGPAEAVFKALIAGVLAFTGERWRVIVSIRSFDLRLGRQFRDLFNGTPPAADLADPAFNMVRHVSIPPWTDGEFAEILKRSPDIGTAIETAGAPLAALARIPFNTRLLADLLSRGTPPQAFAGIGTQASLLGYFWQQRVEAHGSGADLCLRRTIDLMIAAGALSAPALAVASASSASDLDTMQHEGVLVRANGGRDVAFRHHILFDFAASRLLLDPADPQALAATLVGPAALALAPALGFVLTEAWAAHAHHDDFWRIALAVAGDSAADPIARSVIARQAAELPIARCDTQRLVDALSGASTRDAGLRVLRNLLGALSVRHEDGAPINAAPWITVAIALPNLIATGWEGPIGALRLLLHILTDRNDATASEWRELGKVARAFLGIALDHPSARPQIAISFVGKTYDTDRAASRAALEPLLERARLDAFAEKDGPALANEIAPIIAADPGFAKVIYSTLFEYDLTDETSTSLGDSQILSLRSTRRQDYSIARYVLAEAFSAFLARDPVRAIEAMVAAVEAQAARETGADLDTATEVATIDGTFPLVEDRSFIWAWDIADSHPSDAEKLLQATVTFLTEAAAEPVLTAATTLRSMARYGLLWSRFLHAASRRVDVLGDLAWPIASAGGFLVASETSKDAIDAALAIAPQRTTSERAAFERTLLDLDMSGFNDPVAARTFLLRKTLGVIGADQLVTEEAKRWIDSAGENATPVDNARPFSVNISHGTARSWAEEAGVAPDDAEGNALFAQVSNVRDRFGLLDDKFTVDDPSALLSAVEGLRTAIDASKVDSPQTIANASVPVIKAAHALTANSGNLLKDVPSGAQRVTALVEWLSSQSYPVVDDETEENFVEFPSWGAPAPRVDAADLAFDLLRIDPGLSARLYPLIDASLDDCHPAVRLNAAQRLTALWFVDRDEMWSRIVRVAEAEPNPGVLRFFAGHVLARLLSEPDSLEPIVLDLAARNFPTAGQRRTINEHIYELITALWLIHAREQSHAWLETKLADDPVAARDFLFEATGVAGQLIGAGYEDDERIEVRMRAQALLSAIIQRSADAFEEQLALPEDGRDPERLKANIELLDNAVRRIQSAALGTGRTEEGRGLNASVARAHFLQDLAPMLRRIGDVAPPHALHNLVELLDALLDGDPELSFELMAHGVLTAGRTFGYQYESLGAARVVKTVGRALADHRTIFADAGRRSQLVEMLELFVDQGWPQARRLLYELPELFR